MAIKIKTTETEVNVIDFINSFVDNEQKEKDMDLHNNNIGQNIANFFSILNDIEQEVLAQLNFGFLRYLSNLNSNSRPTYLSFLTPTNQ